MRGAPQKGLAWLMRRIRSRMLAATSGLPGRRRDFLVQCQAKARRCQRRTVSGRTISRHRRQPDQHRYNTTHKSRSQRWRRKRRGAFLWKTASWWRSARISTCKAARVRKVEAIKAKKATKRELIVVATMISRLIGTPLISDRTEFSVTTGSLFVIYVRAQAYLAAHRGTEAAAEFQKIIDHIGVVSNDPTIVAAARLQLARALLLVDRGKAKSAYEDFLKLWKDADQYSPILKEAKAEHDRL